MFRRLATRTAALCLVLIPQLAHATMDVNAPFGIDVLLVGMAKNSWKGGFAVCAAIFVAGSFFYIASMGAEDRKGYGKSMMIGAVIGMIVIAGAQVIMNTVLYFVYVV